jgi:hypothetical protein
MDMLCAVVVSVYSWNTQVSCLFPKQPVNEVCLCVPGSVSSNLIHPTSSTYTYHHMQRVQKVEC